MKKLLLSALLLAGSACLPVAAAGAHGPQAIGPKTRDPVCGMYAARYPNWMSEIVLKDGNIVAFDSPLHLFRYRRDPGKYGAGRAASDIDAIYFSDYLERRWVEAQKAYFVAGSRVRSPMNAEDLPAFGSRTTAERFAREQGGRVLSFDQISPQVLQ